MLSLQCFCEEPAVEGRLSAEQSPGREDDLARSGAVQAEQGNSEAGRVPQSAEIGAIDLEAGESVDDEPDDPTVRVVTHEPTQLIDALPRPRGLAVVNATELKRHQPVLIGDMAEVEARRDSSA